MNKINGKSKLIKLIATVIVIVFVFSCIKSLLSRNDDALYSGSSFLENHTTNYNYDTNTSEVNYEVANNAREKYTKILGNNQDEVTVMIYMIGSDLESECGSATADLNEILYSKINDNINIVVQTGGASSWQNNLISDRKIERYAINSEGMYRLDSKVKTDSMTSPEILQDFIEYSADNFRANRYMLILWDHGGGSVAGYGYDENYPNGGSMTLDEMAKALKNSGLKFDFIGFDACLMANIETAIAFEPYADYLIASEETEPSDGWYYTNWIKSLDDNTSIATVDLGKIIIDDYISNSIKSYSRVEATQSIIDLGELAANIKEPLTVFSKATKNKLESDDFNDIAIARSNTKEFSVSSKLDQVDFVNLVENFNVDGSKELAKSVKDSIKYNRTANISNSYGLSAYFPYSALTKVNSMIKIYENINMDDNYVGAIKSFATIAGSGQVLSHNQSSSNTSIFDVLIGDNYYDDNSYSSNDIGGIFSGAFNSYDDYYGYEDVYGSGYDDWFTDEGFDLMADYFFRNKVTDLNKIGIKEKNNQEILALNEDEWKLINNITLNVFASDGQGYIDLGLDNCFSWNENNELVVEYDGTWLSINDHLVSYYLLSDEYVDEDNYKTVGMIPALLNGKRVDIVVEFTNENPYGIIVGAKKLNNNGTVQKGYTMIRDGDEIQFVCDYYSYNGEFINKYILGDSLIVDGNLELNNINLQNDYVYSYCLTDIYGNKHWIKRK